MKGPESRQIYTLYIRTTPAKLWRAITQGKATRKFYFGMTLRRKLKAGSPIQYVDPKGNVLIRGKVLEVKPLKRLVHTFEFHHQKWATTRVTYTLERAGNAVKLTLVHDRLSISPGTARDVSGGWPLILSGLKTLLETGKPLYR